MIPKFKDDHEFPNFQIASNYSRVAYIYVRSRAKYLKFRTITSKFNTFRKPLMQQKYYFIHEMQLLKSSTKLCYARVNRLFPVNATLICFLVVKQSCMINPVVRKINIIHFKDSPSHRKFAQRERKVKATVQ